MSEADIGVTGRLAFRRTFAAPIETVWRYLTEDDLRGQWLCRGTVDPQAGGTIEFKFNPEDFGDERPPDVPDDRYTADFTGEVITYDPPRQLAFLWPGSGPDGKTRVTMSLRSVANGTELHLVHEQLSHDSDTVGSAAGWHAHLERLECRLSRGVAPNFWRRHAELEALYTAQLSELRAAREEE